MKVKLIVKSIFLVFVYLTFLSACEVSLNANISDRSGGVENDYAEEPLSSYAKKYKNALLVSNQAIDNLIKHDYVSFFEQGFAQELKNRVPFQHIESAVNRNIDKYGEIKEYLVMQWNFVPGNEDGIDVLYVGKIVKHEKKDITYIFVFNNDSEYHHFIGFRVKERNGIPIPGQF